MNVPLSRLEQDSTFNVGRTSEITRDELKFQKFVDRIRIKFNGLFLQALERQLILKKIIVPSDWAEIKSQIFIDFSKDNHYAELKDTEVLTARLEVLSIMDEYVGTYYSRDWVRKNILRQDDDLIKEIAKQNEEEPAEDEDEDM